MSAVSRKVVDFKHPKELQQHLDLELRDDGEPDEKLLEYCNDALKYSVRTGNMKLLKCKLKRGVYCT